MMCWQMSRNAPILDSWLSLPMVSYRALQKTLMVEGMLGTLWQIWSIKASIESVMYFTIVFKFPADFEDFFSKVERARSSALLKLDSVSMLSKSVPPIDALVSSSC